MSNDLGDTSIINGKDERGDAPKPYVFQPSPPAAQSRMLSLYKDELNRNWAWEDYHNSINIDKFIAADVKQDVLQAYRVLEVHLSFLASQLQAQALATICDANNTAEGRAFYGIHIARSYLHLEVFGGFVNDLSDRFERENIPVGVDENLPALAIRYKYEQLNQRIGKPLEDHDLVYHVFVFNYIFNIGAVAVLRALRTRIDDECLDVWTTIHSDMLSLVRCNVDALVNCAQVNADLLRAAFNIETATTLELLDADMRVDVRTFMDDMFHALPILVPASTADSATM